MVPLQNRNLGLDVLRAISVAVVLANHAFLVLFVSTGKVPFQGVVSCISGSAVLSIEWLFVLSGYLIGTIMIRSLERYGASVKACKDFWMRRWFRTLPLYYLFLCINVVLSHYLAGTGHFDIAYLVFSQNLLWTGTSNHFFNESWSLAMDEWFYFLMPLIVYFFVRAAKMSVQRAFFITSGLLVCTPMLLRLMADVPAHYFDWDAQIRRITIYHIDATGWGVLAAAVGRWYPVHWQRYPASYAAAGAASVLAGLACIWVLAYRGWQGGLPYHLVNAASISLMCVGTALSLPFITRVTIRSRLLGRSALWISTYSYTLYLTHFPLVLLAKHVTHLNKHSSMSFVALVTCGWLVAVVALSVPIFKLFEEPISNLRNRFTKQIAATPFA